MRVDAFLVIIWLAGMLSKIGIFYFVAVLGAAQLLKLKDYKPLVLPMGVILTALSALVVGNTVEITQYIVSVFPPLAYLFEWVIPAVLLAVAVLRGFKPRF